MNRFPRDPGAAFDFLIREKRQLLSTAEVAVAIGMKQDSVRSLIEEGRLDAHFDSATGRRKSVRVVRRSVLLYLAETAAYFPSEFPRRLRALLGYLSCEELEATAAEISTLLKSL